MTKLFLFTLTEQIATIFAEKLNYEQKNYYENIISTTALGNTNLRGH